MTFKVLNLGSKQPYFNSAYVVRVPIFSFATVYTYTVATRCTYVVFGEKRYTHAIITSLLSAVLVIWVVKFLIEDKKFLRY